MGRTVLITGCSDGGLGAALAKAFHENGDRVFATARDPRKMASLTALGIETLQLDVLSEESIKACVEKVSSMTSGSLDILINNAGAGYTMPMLDASIPEIQKQFELNVWAVLRTSQLFFPLIRNSNSKMLVNNTSVNSVVGLPWQGPYNASKAAIASFTETLRLELQPFGIKVIDLKTGAVRSKFFENTSALTSHTSVPNDSVYAAAKDKIEEYMAKGPEGHFVEADAWAKRVLRDLSKHSPPHQVWRGGGASLLWFVATFVPIGWMDSKIKKLVGLDVVERRIKQEEQTRKST
ncbi:uncharacterized protein Z520_07633 [Fonsecaea multimorphosa CBS 102226]|uniref:Uncharacterized protein n=1 Tax=Fonsecaea multimorphosa CBS 102226 TaxID=1442371 RepID=A0A0D2KK25_9EURO|nr:uncharacterized protein Z520_07633 [Fonsecaea multimorphosa CBS 102226]KIX96913.1 hypothetical protein Z520_07633 [Fonsecaea multimorphosa CBS 102226]OAL22588.1 hypothetical protein AYO22_07146 [Fonsecaea multimorphosa]